MNRPFVRHAVRRLFRAPAFALSVALTLALGIGGTVAVFTVVDAVLVRPLPYPHAEQLVDLSHTLQISGVLHVDQSDATYLTYRQENQVFEDVGIYRDASVNFVPSERGGEPERLTAGITTASTFRVLETGAVRGRGLTDEDGMPGAAPVALIGEGLWHRAFGGDPSVIGHSILVDGVEHTIVGIMPASFQFPSPQTSLWLPLTIDPARTRSAAFDYRGIARLRPAVSIQAANADLQRLLPTVPTRFPGRLSAGGITATHMSTVVRPLRDVIIGDAGRVLWITLGGVVALLLVACANVASLFLARAEGRQRELAVRRALGAGRGALLAEFLSESLILSVVGGVVGLGIAAVAVSVLRQADAGSSIPRLAEVSIDLPVILVALVTTALSGLVVSALPILRSRNLSLSGALAAHGPSAAGGPTRQRTRRVLVAAQVALALVLLAGAGLFARSFAKLRAVDPGFAASDALSFRLAISDADYRTPSGAAGIVSRIATELASIPGVRGVGVTTKLPLDEEAHQDSAVFIEDRPLTPGTMPDIHPMAFVSPDYFTAMRIPLLAGRSFATLDPSRDPSTMPREVVVSEEFANKYWSTVNAVGRRVRMNPIGPWATIVGVVGSVRDAGPEQPAATTVYSPLVTTNSNGEPWIPRDLAFVVRTAIDPAAATAAIRSAVRSAAPTLPVYRVRALQDLESAAEARTTFTLLLLGAAGVAATLVGAAGIFGVIAYLASLRRRELGVRLALGATPANVRGLFVRRAMTDAAVGVVVGVVVVLVLGRVATAALFGVSATDPVALGAAAGILLLTAGAASWLPAKRAAALDPATALRAE